MRDIRAKITDQQVEVGGPTATLIDSRDAIADRLPWAIGLIAVFTFILLFLFTGSVVVPMKALLLNLLVLSRRPRHHGVDLPGRTLRLGCSDSRRRR